MKTVVISCAKYADCWKPFFATFFHHYATHSERPVLLTDKGAEQDWKSINDGRVSRFIGEGDWCNILRYYAASVSEDNVFLLLQEDMWLTRWVDKQKITYAITQMRAMGAGCVRLYPCPGGDDYGDPYVGRVAPGTPYRISCQPAVWTSAYLMDVLRRVTGTAADFEVQGSKASDKLSVPVLAWKREAEPWPMEILCSAVSRGRWSRGAKELADKEGLAVDWSRREMED